MLLNVKEQMFVTKPAHEWLFDGMEDSILNLVNNSNLINLPYDKFGWFYDRNMSASYDGVFKIKTGEDDIYNLGIMDSWNKVNQTKYYEGNCAMVNGTSGELFPPMKGRAEKVSLFISDMCRLVCCTLMYDNYRW